MTVHEEQLELEGRLHSLLCWASDVEERERMLARIVDDEGSRRALREMLRLQQACRQAAGLDRQGGRAGQSLVSVRAMLTEPASPAAAPHTASRRYRWGSPAAWVRVAAVVVLAVSVYAAWSVHRSRRIAEDGRGVSGEAAAPDMRLSGEDLGRYRTIWTQVADGGNTWVLLREGSGQFGSIATASAPAKGGSVLLVQCRVLDDKGAVVYSADVLLPDQPSLKVRLAEAGQLAGQRAALAVTAAGGQATVGLSLQGSAAAGVGVTGRAPFGVSREVGRFRLEEQDLRLIIRTEKLIGFQA